MQITIDLTPIRNMEDFHDKICETLDCPPYYGRNLDALYDVLTDYSTPLHLNFAGYTDFAQDLPGYGTPLKDLCLEAMAENSLLTICLDGAVLKED